MLVHSNGRLKHSPGIGVDGVVFSFKGPGTSAVMIEEPLNPILNYYELEIVNSGESCSIGIGCGEMHYPLSRMPGWNVNSVGYHSDDGRLYSERGIGSEFGPKCYQGDRMGCGIDFTPDNVSVFFTRNGEFVGRKVRMKRPVYGFYPIIGLHSAGEVVRYVGHVSMDPNTLSPRMMIDSSPSDLWLRSNAINFLDDGLTLEYGGDGSANQDVAIAQSKHKLDANNHYFEMAILSTGFKGALAIGLAKSNYPLNVHPGWNKGSIGYHADDGKLFVEQGAGHPFGPPCSDGDIMGCGIRIADDHSVIDDNVIDSSDDECDSEIIQEKPHRDGPIIGYGRPEVRRRVRGLIRAQQRQSIIRTNASQTSTGVRCTVYFTRNGELIGERQTDLPKGGLYPVVAMLSKGEKLRVNFDPLTG